MSSQWLSMLRALNLLNALGLIADLLMDQRNEQDAKKNVFDDEFAKLEEGL